MLKRDATTARSADSNSRQPTVVASLCVCAIVCGLGALGCYAPPETGTVTNGPLAPAVMSPDDVRLGPDDLHPGRSDIRLGMAPVLDARLMVQQFEPLTDYLAESLGVPVELHIATSYTDLIDRIVANTIDLAILPPASFLAAQDRDPSIRILASQIAAGATSYSSYIVVRGDSPFQRLIDLKGRTLSLVDEVSASGYYLPWAAFLEAGMDPKRDLAAVGFAGSHTAALRNVIEGRADAAATYSGMLGFARRELDGGAADLRILHKAGRLPGDALCAGSALPEVVGKKAGWALMMLDTRSALGNRVYALTNNQVSGWGPPLVDRYDALRATIRRVDAAGPRGAERTVPLSKEMP